MKQKPTSKAAHEFIKPHKPNHKERILEALVKMKGGGTYEAIAHVAGMRPDQVWKRLSELAREQKIFETGSYRKLSSGVNGTVWQIVGSEAAEIEKKLPKTSNKQTQLTLL